MRLHTFWHHFIIKEGFGCWCTAITAQYYNVEKNKSASTLLFKHFTKCFKANLTTIIYITERGLVTKKILLLKVSFMVMPRGVLTATDAIAQSGIDPACQLLIDQPQR